MRAFAVDRFPTRGDRAAGGPRPVVRRLRLVHTGDALGDYPPAYASWAAAVKSQGGVVTTWPASLAPTVHAKKPAARYTTAQYGALFNAAKINPKATQTAAPNGYVYVLAPADAIVASLKLGQAGSPNNPAETAIYEETLWKKFGLPDLGKYQTPLLIAGGVLLTIALLHAIGAARGSRGSRA